MSVYAQDYGYFFNSNNSDRTYNADSFETWLKPFFVSGVFTGCLQVQAQSTPDMTVKVTKGYANLDGKAAYWPDDNTVTIETASGVYSRIDTIVLRRDNTNRRVSIEVVKGTASATPQPVAPTRNADTFELVLAEVLVGVGVTEITGSVITDKRPDTDVCGYVVAAVQTPDFSELYAQFAAQAEEFMGDQADEFIAWFDEMKDQLSEDAAGHLQLEIDGKADKVTGEAIEGRLVALDSTGNLTNSGYKPTSYLGAHSVVTHDYSHLSTVPAGGISKNALFIRNTTLYRAKRDISAGTSFLNLTSSDIEYVLLAEYVDSLNSKLTWKKATSFTPITATTQSASYTEKVVSELAGADEIRCVCGASGGQTTYILDLFPKSTVSAYVVNYHAVTTGDATEAGIATRFDKSNNKIGFRQTYKSSGSSYLSLLEVWYR